MSSNFRNFCHKIKGRISYHNESNKKFWHHTFCVFMSSISDIPDTKKAEFLITMRAIKSLDYILFCLQMCSWRLIVNKKYDLTGNWHSTSEYPSTKKPRISCFNKSNWKIWHHAFYAMCPYEDSLWTNRFWLFVKTLTINFRIPSHKIAKVLSQWVFISTCEDKKVWSQDFWLLSLR